MLKHYQSKLSARYVPVDATQIALKITKSDYYLASVKQDGNLVASFVWPRAAFFGILLSIGFFK